MSPENVQFTQEGEWARTPVIKRPRIVVTGIGMVSPLGTDTESTWQNLIGGKSGISHIDNDEMARLATLAEVEHLKDAKLNIGVGGLIDRDYKPSDYISTITPFNRSDARRMSRATQLSLAASVQALQNGGAIENGALETTINPDRMAVIIGTSEGGLSYVATIGNRVLNGQRLFPTGPLKVGPERVSSVPSMIEKIRGPKFTPIDACATGSQAIIAGIEKLIVGAANRALVGGADATVEPVSLAMFDEMRALNRTHDPYRASTPFDTDRKGFVMSEGAGVLLLETEEAAHERNARIIAEVAGYGAASDAYNDTDPEGFAARESLGISLMQSGIRNEGLFYINAHGTSTVAGDKVEIEAIRTVLEQQVPQSLQRDIPYAISSSKASMGHTMGASGAIEAGIAILALRDQILPPTINLQHIMPEALRNGVPIDLVPNEARQAEITLVGSGNFGFGGSGTHILFKPYRE